MRPCFWAARSGRPCRRCRHLEYWTGDCRLVRSQCRECCSSEKKAADAATQQSRIAHCEVSGIIRTQSKATLGRGDRSERDVPGLGSGLAQEVLLGYIVQYNTEWFPLGHSLGQITYSLPLAPWAKKCRSQLSIGLVENAAKRNEQTTEKEDLQHAALRDRTLTEAVHMVVTESQSGSSFMAGGALSAGAGIPIGPCESRNWRRIWNWWSIGQFSRNA